MAFLRKKDRSPFWFACYPLPDGRRTQRSTGTDDKRKAMAVRVKTSLCYEIIVCTTKRPTLRYVNEKIA
jgi:hypothetical protein